MNGLSDTDRAGTSLRRALEALRIEATGAMIEDLLRFCDLLLRWNRRTNLTGATSATALVEGPLFDSLTLLAVLEPRAGLLDIGSGGGLPGIPAALATPGLEIALLEPRAKRAAFLRHAVEALSLRATVIQGRLETLEPGAWSGAVAQAVWSPALWMRKAAALMGEGTAVYVLSTSPPSGDDIPSGLGMEAAEEIVRPFDGAKRFAARLRRAAVDETRPG